MENQSNSSHAREQNRLNSLNIYCDKKAGALLAGLSISHTKKSLADLIITFKDNYLILNDLRISSLTRFPSNDIGLKLLYSALKSIEKSTLENLTDSFISSEKKLFKRCSDLSEFLMKFSTVPMFKNYTSGQIFIHERGKSTATSLIKSRDSYHETQNTTVSSFNNIYTKIKKSKNKLFDQSDILSDDIKIVGSFLAKEFNFDNNSVIFILSREDFFSPSDEEKEYFQNFLTISTHNILNLVNKFHQKKKHQQFRELIYNFPFYIKVTLAELSISSSHKRTSKVISKKFKDINIEYDALEEHQSDPEYYHHERLILMGELLNTLRHELSNPLFGINISTNLLLSDDHQKDKIINDTIEEIGKSSQRCQSIIENFSGLYGDRNLLQDIDIQTLIKETLTLTKSESKHYKQNVTYCDDSTNLIIHTNPTYLSQIIFNLVINSSQALNTVDQDNKSINIDVKRVQDLIKITIEDNGPGIKKKQADQIFDAFYTTKSTGTGLGLSICKSLAAKINGSLQLNKDYQNGACFVIEIPVRNGQ